MNSIVTLLSVVVAITALVLIGGSSEMTDSGTGVEVYNSMTPIKPVFADDWSVSDYCDPQVARVLKEVDYEGLIRGIDGAVAGSGSKAIIANNLDLIGQKAQCLNQLYGHLTPGRNYADSIATFSDHTQTIFMDNYDTLKEVAPNLVNNVTVPEFPSGMGALLASSAASLGLIILLKRKSNY